MDPDKFDPAVDDREMPDRAVACSRPKKGGNQWHWLRGSDAGQNDGLKVRHRTVLEIVRMPAGPPSADPAGAPPIPAAPDDLMLSPSSSMLLDTLSTKPLPAMHGIQFGCEKATQDERGGE